MNMFSAIKVFLRNEGLRGDKHIANFMNEAKNINNSPKAILPKKILAKEKYPGPKNNENEIFQIKYLNQILTTNYLMKKGAMYFIVHSENCTEIKDKYQLDKELAQQKGYAKLGIEHPINLKNEVSGCYSWYIETGCKYPINRTTLN